MAERSRSSEVMSCSEVVELGGSVVTLRGGVLVVGGGGAVPRRWCRAPVTALPEVEEDAGVVEPGVVGVVVRGEVAPVVLEGSVVPVVLSASAVVAVVSEVSGQARALLGAAHVEDGHYGQAQGHEGGGRDKRQAAAAQAVARRGRRRPGPRGRAPPCGPLPSRDGGRRRRDVPAPAPRSSSMREKRSSSRAGSEHLECVRREDLLLSAGGAAEYVS